MKKSQFLEAKGFMFSDIEREIQLARADKQTLGSLGVNPGGGNFLAALGLLCYTEFGGKLRFGHKLASKNFNDFFDLLGTAYNTFRKEHNVYDIFRCGLAHEYYIKKNCTIAMLESSIHPGISIDESGRYYFIVESYHRDLKQAFSELETFLYDEESLP